MLDAIISKTRLFEDRLCKSCHTTLKYRHAQALYRSSTTGGTLNTKAAMISRRRFLKLLAGAPALAALGPAGLAQAQPRQYGKLVDTITCIGCKRCMSACKRWNNLKVERDELLTDRNWACARPAERMY